MNRFASLLDRLAYEPRRNAKLRLMADYFRHTPDPERGWALAGRIVICPPSSLSDLWSRKLPDPVAAYASGWMRVRARARQSGAELPLVISDHADWPDLQRTILETGCSELWVTHGQEDALVHWAAREGLAARPLHMVGYGEEESEAP